MPQRCKGTCQQLLGRNDDLDIEVRKYIRYGYLNGYKRCSICEVFIKSLNPTNMKCFCCGVQLRSRPYKSTLKENFRNSLNNNNQCRKKKSITITTWKNFVLKILAHYTYRKIEYQTEVIFHEEIAGLLYLWLKDVCESVRWLRHGLF